MRDAPVPRVRTQSLSRVEPRSIRTGSRDWIRSLLLFLAPALLPLLPLLATPTSTSATPEGVSTRIDGLRDLGDRARAARAGREEMVRMGTVAVPWRIAELPAHPDEGETPVARPGATTWAAYTGPFGVEEAAHLLHRTMIGATWEEIEAAAQQGLDATVNQLLAPSLAPIPPGAWATEPVPDVSGWTPQMIDSLIAEYNTRREILRGWWPDMIVDRPAPNITETMVLFWHDHFATAMDKVYYPQSMYVQNALFRQHATGNFKELTLAASLDPAMLLWLDNQYNWVGQINENFARELLELFTLGVGHYTQEDIVETARAFTGYMTLDGVTSGLQPWAHDYGTKTILGATGPWFADDVIDIVFAQDQCARFLCTKLYQWFIDEYPDPARIEELAAVLRQNDYEIRPVLEMMFESEHFFDENFRGSVISDGVDQYLGRVRTFHLGPQVNFSDYLSNQRVWLNFSMTTYNQILFDPPNVAGWPGYRTWINSYTLPWRKELNVALVDGQIYGWPLYMQLDALDFGLSLSSPNDPYAIVDDVGLLLFGMPPTELVRQRMLDELLQGAEPWEWSIFDPNATDRLRGLVRLALRLPDAQSK